MNPYYIKRENMADFLAHLNQAKYNRKFAIDLAKIGTRRDWAITVAFYAALHFVEAGLIGKNQISTTDRSIDDDISIHEKRVRSLLNSYGEDIYRPYRKLMTASRRVRYLDNNHNNLDDPPAASYYSPDQIEKFVNKDLDLIWNLLIKYCPCDLK